MNKEELHKAGDAPQCVICRRTKGLHGAWIDGPPHEFTFGDAPKVEELIDELIVLADWSNTVATPGKRIERLTQLKTELLALIEKSSIPTASSPSQGWLQRGQSVYVSHPRFHGYGIAQYDSGERQRVIGVKLENGNTWDYEAETVRIATKEEYDKMPKVIREQAERESK